VRKFYLYILSFFLVISLDSYSQTATTPTISNSNGVVDNTITNKMFYGRDNNASCCGNIDPSNRNMVTYEAINLTLDAFKISDLQNSTSHFTNNNGYTNNLLEYNGGLNSGDVVNVYMVYLNDNASYRSTSNAPKFTFEGDIVAVGYDWNHTLWFSGSRFGSTESLGDDYYPRYTNAGSTSKFKDRRFEPSSGTNDNHYNGWNNGVNSTKYWLYHYHQNELTKSSHHNWLW